MTKSAGSIIGLYVSSVGAGVGVGAEGRGGSGVGAGMGWAQADKTSRTKTNMVTQRRFMTVCYFRESAMSNKTLFCNVLRILGLDDEDIAETLHFPAMRRKLLDKLQVKVVVFCDRIELNAIFPLEPILCQKCTPTQRRGG
jgi:hypothetical protein